MFFKFLVQTTLTYFLISILNCVLDEFILFGVSKVMQPEDNVAEKKKESKLNKGLQILNGRFLSNFSNVSSYAQAGFFILIGIMISLYLINVLAHTWRFIFNKNRHKSILHMSNLYSNLFIIVSIVIDICLVAYFVLLSDRALKEYQIQKKNLHEFQIELTKLNLFTKNYSTSLVFFKNVNKKFEFNDRENSLRIGHSIAKLESYFYCKYLNFNVAAVSSFSVAILTLLFLLLEFC